MGRLGEVDTGDGRKDWGDWRLGDLSDAIRRVSDTLGPSTPAASVSVYPPDTPDALPIVWVRAPDAASVETIRSELLEGDSFTRLLTHGDRPTFQAEVSELLLHVWCIDATDES